MTILSPAIIDCFNKNKLIPIIGAGVSMDVKTINNEHPLPSWKQLLLNGVAALEHEGEDKQAIVVLALTESGDFQIAADFLKKGLKGNAWGNFLKSQFIVDYTKLDDSSKKLAQSIWNINNKIITLNYENILKESNQAPSNVHSFDSSNADALGDFINRSQQERPLIWHLHGHIDVIDSIIFTGGSYKELYSPENSHKFKAAISALKTTLASNSLLFLGCSLSDVELLSVLKDNFDLFNGNQEQHYAFIHENNKPELQRFIDDKELPIKLFTYPDYGAPFVDLIDELTKKKV